MLRGERDQNRDSFQASSDLAIPECSGGSEIKTVDFGCMKLTDRYQNAPGGARSKLRVQLRQQLRMIPECSGGSEIKTGFAQAVLRERDTRMLRGERDQNLRDITAKGRKKIPECSGGSEIKTGQCR